MWKVLVSGIFLVLCSCSISMSEEEMAEHLLCPPSLNSSLSEALQESYFVQDGWPAPHWWELYRSEELNALIAQALEQNPTIQSVQAKVAFAKESAIVVRSQLYPLVYFDASDQWSYLSQNGLYRALNPDIALNNQQIDFSLSFFYEFDFWGKYRNLYRAALGYEKAAVAELAQAELITATSLAQSYFALITNLVRQTLYQELYDIRKSLYELQADLENSSLRSILPQLLSEEDVFQAKQWVLKIEEEIAANRHIVNVLAGRGPDEPIQAEAKLPQLPSLLALPADISMELLSRRPDLMAQIWRVDALAREVGAARADFWPNVNLTGTAGYQSGAWSSLFAWASKMAGLTPALSLPVYTAGAIGANAHAKKALFDEAVYQYNDLILKSFREVADLLAIGRSVYGQKEQQMRIVQNAKERYCLTRLRQIQGIDSALDSYRQLETMLMKQLEDVQLLYSQYLVSVQLIRALGGGYFTEKCDGS